MTIHLHEDSTMLEVNRREFVKRIGHAAAAITGYSSLSGIRPLSNEAGAVTAADPLPDGTAADDLMAANLARMQSWLLDDACLPKKDAKLADQITAVNIWAMAAFLGTVTPPSEISPLQPLVIGAQKYPCGVSSPVNKPTLIRLPESGQWFEAHIGVDNTTATPNHGFAAGAVFVVLLKNLEIFRSPALYAGEDPVRVKIDLKGSREFTINVLPPGGVNPVANLAVWADAKVTFTNGQTQWLDKTPGISGCTALSSKAVPFSFTYAGKNLRDMLSAWKRQVHKRQEAGLTRYAITYNDPATKLEVRCDLRVFHDFPAVDWVLHLTNHGSVDTPILHDIRPLDLNLTLPTAGDFILHHSNGSSDSALDFLPHDQIIGPNDHIVLAPQGGRSSSGVLPFFNLQWRGGGMVAAIGWTGQWVLNLQTDSQRCASLRAGQQTTHFKLHPGETVRTPSIALLPWRGDAWINGANLFRRLMLAHFAARIDGKLAIPPISMSSYYQIAMNDVSEKNQIQAISAIAKDSYHPELFWIDAGWFKGGWWDGVGNWMPKAKAFPRGLRPVADAANKNGMQFILWFEPERVGPGTAIDVQHPQWVIRFSPGDGLFAMGNPDARRWMTKLLAKRIYDWRMGVLRHDFNIEPLPFWQAMDKPDRQGISEIRYIEGLYAMWDELRKTFPYLAIDCCASGGRRIDLESIKRCFYLYRSDCVGDGLPHGAWNQLQSGGLNIYVPTNATGTNIYQNAYYFRSSATAGLGLGIRQSKSQIEQMRLGLDEIREIRHLYFGDYYPLTPINLDGSQWAAWQFDRPEIGMGLAMYFRRPSSPFVEAVFPLQNIDPRMQYEVAVKDDTFKVAAVKKMIGAQLVRYCVTIPHAPGTSLLIYREKKS